MPTPKTLAGYSERYFTIAELTLKEGNLKLAMKSKGAAINFRVSWYSWRKLLVEQRVPLGIQAGEIQVRLGEDRGTWYLHFSCDNGLPAIAIAMLDKWDKEKSTSGNEEVEVITQPLPPEAAFLQSLDTDAWLERYMKPEPAEGGARPEQKAIAEAIDPANCKHEWGTYNCLKCGVPLPKPQ